MSATSSSKSSQRKGRLSIFRENGKPQMYRFSGGYYDFKDDGSLNDSHYYIADYMGNNRMVVNGTTGTVEQINHYYPYGGVIGNLSSNEALQAFKFEDKELDRTYGLDWYDIQARQYDAAAPTWNAPDPLAEKYYRFSPYNFCGGNPVNYGDYNGMSISVSGDSASIAMLVSIMNQYGNNTYYYENGKIEYVMGEDTEYNGYDKVYSEVINSDAEVSMSIVSESSKTILAEFDTRTIDISDVEAIGNQVFITSGSIVGHEFYEQMRFLDDNSNLPYTKKIERAHLGACHKEPKMTAQNQIVGYLGTNYGHNPGLDRTFHPKLGLFTFVSYDPITNNKTSMLVYECKNGNIGKLKNKIN